MPHSSVQKSPNQNFPTAPRDNTVDQFHGVSVADPYRPLENSDNPETQAWIAKQNERLEEFLAPQKDYRANMVHYLATQMDYPRFGLPQHYGQNWFRIFNPGLAPQSVHQVASSPDGPWRTLLDPMQMDPSGVTSVMETFVSDDGKLVAYTISIGGDDERTLYVMNVETGEKLLDIIPNCRFVDLQWDADRSGFHYSYSPVDGTKRRIIKHHALGADISKDRNIFAHPNPESIAGFSRARHSKTEFVYVAIGTNDSTGWWMRRPGEADFICLIPAEQEDARIIDLFDGKIYAVSKLGATRGQLVRFDPATPDKREILIREHEEHVLNDVFYRHGHLFLCYGEDTASAVYRIDLNCTTKDKMPLPPQTVVEMAHDNPEDTGCYIRIAGHLSPGTFYYYDYAKNDLTLFAKSAVPDTLEDCILERVRIPSKDGTLVPMTIIRHPDTKLDGTAALKLYGYGGFNVPLTPSFSALGVLAWVRQGGIFVEANLRGGGEFGSAWYDAGRLHNKKNVFDDFAACAGWLIKNNYTSSKRLVSQGGSNGGLLTLVTMMQRPDLYGVALSQVPVADMLRFDRFTYGAYWKSDYGDPQNNEADFKVSMTYSPLHNVKDGATYPPHLVLTADKDTRVVPMHSYKFVATIQEKADPQTLSFLSVETDAGHGAGTALQKKIEETATIMAFCRAVIGPFNQNEYKNWVGNA